MTILRDGAVVPLPCRRSVACRLTGGDWYRADDLVPDTMADALHARYQVTPGTSRKAWLLASLRNRFHSVVGRQPAKAEVHGAKLGPLRSTPAAQAVGTVTSRARRARERLRRMRLDEAAPLGEPAIRRRAVAADPIVATHAWRPAMTRGAIKWFHDIMGYGVIAPDDGTAGVLVRLSAAEAARLGRLRKGDRLEYDTVRGANGRALAVNVRQPAEAGE
jgi:cold shock CspA family protein